LVLLAPRSASGGVAPTSHGCVADWLAPITLPKPSLAEQPGHLGSILSGFKVVQAHAEAPNVEELVLDGASDGVIAHYAIDVQLADVRCIVGPISPAVSTIAESPCSMYFSFMLVAASYAASGCCACPTRQY
jgi:hypothetical protein